MVQVGSTSDADAPEGHEHQPRNLILENPDADGSEASCTHQNQNQHQHTSPSLNSEQEPKVRQAPEQSGRAGSPNLPPVRFPTLLFPSADKHTRLSLDALNIHNQQSLTMTNDDMASTGQPVVDDHGDSDYDDMASSRSSDGYSPRFEPSLPFLVSRVVTPDASEPDELSLSGDTASNADTVSDQLDAQDDADSFTNITHEDIPDEIRESLNESQGSPFEVEESDQIVMSNDTIVPTTPTLSHRVPSIESTADTAVAFMNKADGKIPLSSRSEDIVSLPKADKPYSMTGRRLYFLFVADRTVDRELQLLLVAKLVSAISGKDVDKGMIVNAPEPDVDCVGTPFHQRYEVQLSKKKMLNVIVDHAVAFSDEGQVKIKNGPILDLAGGSLPDFAILFHSYKGSQTASQLHQGVFPQGDQGRQFVRALSNLGVPMLEVVSDQASPLSSVLNSTMQGKQAHPFLHVRHTRHQQSGGVDSQPSSRLTPIPLTSFIDLDNQELSRHLALISKQHESKHGKSSSNGQFLKTALFSPSAVMFYVTSILLGLTALAGFYGSLIVNSVSLDPLSDLTVRQEALQLAMNRSTINSVNASRILHYPTTTGVSSGTATVGLAFPTSIDVHVAKSDQLFVAFPKAYRSSAYIALFRNGKNLSDYNVTKLIDGVYGLTLKSSDAWGQVHLMFRSTVDSTLNETVKVDLGNRLLHRATYENAARDVQHNVEDVQHVAKAVQARLMNNTHSALKTSAYRARALRESVYGTASNAAQRISLGYQGITNTTSSMIKSSSNLLASTYVKDMQKARNMTAFARNATCSFGSGLMNKVPSKQDFNRARLNSLKLKEKLLRTPVAPAQKNATIVSVFSRFKELGLQAGHFPQEIYSDVLAPGIRKLFSKEQKCTVGKAKVKCTDLSPVRDMKPKSSAGEAKQADTASHEKK